MDHSRGAVRGPLLVFQPKSKPALEIPARALLEMLFPHEDRRLLPRVLSRVLYIIPALRLAHRRVFLADAEPLRRLLPQRRA